jgi:hypothetical protein
VAVRSEEVEPVATDPWAAMSCPAIRIGRSRTPRVMAGTGSGLTQHKENAMTPRIGNVAFNFRG